MIDDTQAGKNLIPALEPTLDARKRGEKKGRGSRSRRRHALRLANWLIFASRPTAVLFFLAMICAFAGQYYFARKPDYMWDGLVLYAASFVVMGLLARALRPPRPASVREPGAVVGTIRSFIGRHPTRSSFYALAGFGALSMLQQLRSLPEGADHYPMAAVWILSLVALGIACSSAPAFPRLGQLRPALNLYTPVALERLAFASITLFAFFIRFVSVASLPANFGGDEGSQGLSAVAIMNGQTKNIFGVGWFTVPNTFFLFQALFLRVFGDSVFGLRMMAVVVGTASVAFCYLLVRRLFGTSYAVVATVLFASYHYHIHYSRLGSAQIGDSFFIVAVLYLLLRGMDTGGTRWFIAAGVLLGLTQYFYFGARLIPLLVVAYCAYLWVRDRQAFMSRRSGLVHMVLFALLTAWPYLVYSSLHPDLYVSRFNQVGIFQSGWYSRELAMGRDAVSVLTEQALRSLLAFNLYPDKVYWYHPGIPLLDFFSSVFFAVGLAYATCQWRDSRYLVVSGSYWLGLFMGAFMTENPPSSMRLVILSPLASILVAIGIMKIVDWSAHVFELSSLRRATVLSTIVGLACLISVVFYFGDYSRHRTEGYGGPNTEVATEMAWYLKGLGTDYRVYFFGAPRMYLDFATIPFIDRGIQGMDVKQPLVGQPSFVGQETKSVFIFLPERQRELNAVRQYIPGGVEEQTVSKEGGQTLFVSYRVER